MSADTIALPLAQQMAEMNCTGKIMNGALRTDLVVPGSDAATGMLVKCFLSKMICRKEDLACNFVLPHPSESTESQEKEIMIRKEQLVEVPHVQGGNGTVKFYHILNKEELGGIGRVYARVVLDPGCSIGWHQHSGETEPYYILSGEGTFVDHDGSKTIVTAGDVCTIEDGQFHSIENNSDAPMEFMALIYNLI